MPGQSKKDKLAKWEHPIGPDDPLPDQCWLTLPGESANAFRAFTTYRKLEGNRTVFKAYVAYIEAQGKPLTRTDATARFYIWHKQYRWRERAAAFDSEMEKQEISTLRRKRLANARRRVDAMDEALDVLALPATVAMQDTERLAEELKKLPAAELVKLVRHALGAYPEALKAEAELIEESGGGQTAALPAVPVEALRAAFKDPETMAVLERVTVMTRGKESGPPPIQVEAQVVDDEEAE